MKNIRLLVFFLSVGILISCNSKQKREHSHDLYSEHVHEKHDVYQDYYGAYSLIDSNYGTSTKVSISGDMRIMTTNALPNHKTGQFPNKGNPNTIKAQNRTYSFPILPKYIGDPSWVREPGIALNGIKFEPGTAEVVYCESGENYRVEAFQDIIDLGLDFNHAHVQPTGAYHYHGTPTSVIESFDTGDDLVHIGFAHDGFPMYYSKSSAFTSSYKLIDGNRQGENCSYENPMTKIDVSSDGHYDGMYTSDFEYIEGHGDLDACNGVTIDGKYMYIITSEFPYISRCLMGEVSREERKGPPPGADSSRDRRDPRGQNRRPNFSQLLEMMDENNDGKISNKESKGPLKSDFSKIDADRDGYISKNELENLKKTKR